MKPYNEKLIDDKVFKYKEASNFFHLTTFNFYQTCDTCPKCNYPTKFVGDHCTSLEVKFGADHIIDYKLLHQCENCKKFWSIELTLYEGHVVVAAREVDMDEDGFIQSLIDDKK